MTETMIERWNERVGRGDMVYHLGDFAMSWGARHRDLVDELLARLHGQKFLLKGNHDRREVVRSDRWVKVWDLKEIAVDLGGPAKQRIVLCHDPLRTWHGVSRGTWMLHGHCHGNLPDPGGRILDVGVDAWDFAPVSLEQIGERMAERPIVVEEGHRGTTDETRESDAD